MEVGKISIFGVERPPLTQKCVVGCKPFLCSVLLDLPKEWRNAETAKSADSLPPRLYDNTSSPCLKDFRLSHFYFGLVVIVKGWGIGSTLSGIQALHAQRSLLEMLGDTCSWL